MYLRKIPNYHTIYGLIPKVKIEILNRTIMITLREGKGLEQAFFEILGSNPLKLGIHPLKEEWGRYVYANVLRVNANDFTAADQVATITRNAYASVNEVIALHQAQIQNENRNGGM